MLTLQRQEMILKLLKEKGSVTTQEISEKLGISESTARRDISYLDKEGKLSKVLVVLRLKNNSRLRHMNIHLNRRMILTLMRRKNSQICCSSYREK